jgi:hypothetical protein
VLDKLAYYSSGDLGVLGPRGWHCFGLYGSNGSVLIVTPEPHGADLFDPNSELNGPAIQLSFSNGDTSGRFEVAQVAARLFPVEKPYVERVIRENIEPGTEFPRGPFPGDRIRRLSPVEVEFQTPAHADGMGTRSRLAKNGDPISGFAKMTKDNNLVLLVTRLPPPLRYLTSAIVRTTERQ